MEPNQREDISPNELLLSPYSESKQSGLTRNSSLSQRTLQTSSTSLIQNDHRASAATGSSTGTSANHNNWQSPTKPWSKQTGIRAQTSYSTLGRAAGTVGVSGGAGGSGSGGGHSSLTELPNLLFVKIQSHIEVSNFPPTVTKTQILQQSIQSIEQLFQQIKHVHQDRLYYTLAGLLFHSWAPLPFGGSKTKPGYVCFTGETTRDLLDFIVTESVVMYWNLKGRDAIDFVAKNVNEVVKLYYQEGKKDYLDELCLKGMKKAGHIKWKGDYFMPPHLRYTPEEKQKVSVLERTVEFSSARTVSVPSMEPQLFTMSQKYQSSFF
ncbi:hypothetical protein BDR26DRAFT_875524 [Obelidium mucronatum]|nr:hypothetical protein BDR26DRAFT_875524 [Obelidium mucronatum]